MMMLMTPSPVLPQDVHVGLPGFSGTAGEVLAAVAAEPAGPWLAVLLDGLDPTALTSGELVEYLGQCDRVKNWAEARATDAVAELSRRPDVTCADKEAALALRIPAGAAAQLIWVARRVSSRLPAVMRAFRHGDLSYRHVEKIVKATSRVTDPDLLDTVSDRVLGRAAGRTADEVGRHARDVVRDLDPAAAQQRAKDARAEADVVMYPADADGMTDIVASLPVEDAAIVKAGVDAYAFTAKNSGDQRRVGVLRGEGLTRMVSSYLTGQNLNVGSAPRSGGRPVEVAVTVDLETALGRRDLPGEVPGHGIVPREVIAEMIARELPKLRLLVIDDNTGRLLHRASEAYRPTAEQVAHVRAAYVRSAGPGSLVSAERCDIDHVIPHPEGATVIGNLAPFDRSWHGDKTRKSLTVSIDDMGTITVTTPLGQTRQVDPYDYRACKQPAPSSPDVENPDATSDPDHDDQAPPF